MQAMAISGFLTGLVILFGIIFYEPLQKNIEQADAYALGFISYRNAVNSYAFKHQNEGSIPLDLLKLPTGIKLKGWKNSIVKEAGELHCYVYGEATAYEIQSVAALLKGSIAIGWNNKGTMVRNGTTYMLPAFIPDKSLVSVISLH